MKRSLSILVSCAVCSLLAQEAAAAEARMPIVGALGAWPAMDVAVAGDVFLADTSDFNHLKLIEHLALEGNPGRVSFASAGLLIPAGYQDLLLRSCPRLSEPSVTGEKGKQP